MHLLKNKYRAATIIAVIAYSIGLFGILFFNKAFFITAAPYNVLLMCALLFYTQTKINSAFILFTVACFVIGFAAEFTGVSTGLIFGKYTYGSSLGITYKNVPIITGVYWFILIYCCGITIQTVLEKLSAKLADMTGAPSPAIRFFSVMSDGAMLAVFFDWITEPAAVKLGYWSWLDAGEIPLYNYMCVFIISAVLLVLFSLLKFNKQNIFAVNLLMIMMMFFMLIRTFL